MTITELLDALDEYRYHSTEEARLIRSAADEIRSLLAEKIAMEATIMTAEQLLSSVRAYNDRHFRDD